MVKKAERVVKRSPLRAVFGVVIALGLAVAAWFIAQAVIPAVPQIASLARGSERTQLILNGAIAFMIWLPLFALANLLVAVIAGKDPDDLRAKPLPPRQLNKKK
jgi:hypothetical protein